MKHLLKFRQLMVRSGEFIAVNFPVEPPARLRVDFMYDVDKAVLAAMDKNEMHNWTCVELRSICRKHGIAVSGSKYNPLFPFLFRHGVLFLKQWVVSDSLASACV